MVIIAESSTSILLFVAISSFTTERNVTFPVILLLSESSRHPATISATVSANNNFFSVFIANILWFDLFLTVNIKNIYQIIKYTYKCYSVKTALEVILKGGQKTEK